MKFIKNTKIMTEKRPFAMCVYGTLNACQYYETSRWYSFFLRSLFASYNCTVSKKVRAILNMKIKTMTSGLIFLNIR